MQSDLHEIALSVNGKSYRRVVESRMLLSDFLRHELMLAGTHVGCDHSIKWRAGTFLPDARGTGRWP
jgi:carbon-monoxide dehydrogenase small subunit